MRRLRVLVAGLIVLVPAARGLERVRTGLVPPALKVYGSGVGDGVGIHPGALGVGDLNDDGIPDIVLGASVAGPTDTASGTGEAGVLFGPVASGNVTDLRINPPDLVIYGRLAQEDFGRSVLVRDLNGDSIDDLVVGHWESRRPDPNDSVRGEVCIFFGPLAQGVKDLNFDEPDLSITGINQGDGFGASLAAGDVSGDGKPDLAVGAGFGAYQGIRNLGTVAVIYGPFDRGPLRQLAVTPPDVLLVGPAVRSDFGYTLAIADVSGDGVDDIAVSAPAIPGLNGNANAGQVLVTLGGLVSGTVLDFRTMTPDVIASGLDANDYMGRALAAGDITGDGQADLIMGSPAADGPGNITSDSGEVHVIQGPLSRGTRIDQALRASDTILYAPAAGAQLGTSLSLGRDARGEAHLLASAPLSTACTSGGVVYRIDGMAGMNGAVDIDTLSAATAFGGDGVNLLGLVAVLADVTGDGELDPLIGFWSDGPAEDRPAAGGFLVANEADRCEFPSPGLSPTGLRVRRSGDDVLLDFEATGLGDDSVGVDAFRGTLAFLWNTGYNHVQLHPCGLSASPARDPSAAAVAQPGYYYLATRACPDACSTNRLFGSFGESSSGPRPRPGLIPADSCP